MTPTKDTAFTSDSLGPDPEKVADRKKREIKELESVVIRFAGDSGDGIQLTGSQFSDEVAAEGNDLSTLPNFPAEIRAPAGTIAGVSGFQINFGSLEINTPGDVPSVLVAMNPAALKANIKDLEKGGILILNEDTFTEKNLTKVGYDRNPCHDKQLLSDYQVHVVPVTRLTQEALVNTGLNAREIERCKNFFTLGIVLWMFNRSSQTTLDWIQNKFTKQPQFAEANTLALKAGMAYADATEIFSVSFVVKPAKLRKGTYRSINGTVALSYGLISASQKSGLPIFFGAYPITPATDLLHELAKHKHLGIMTFQAEDEIAAIGATIGASYAGHLGITSSSGPGMALKGEFLGLAVITELPLVIVNSQRGGPSTGLPTKTEQSDLFQAIYGRHGEAPLCVMAASSPSTAFEVAYEACRVAIKYMTPVILLSDGYINNCSEPWQIRHPESLPEIPVHFVPSEEAGEFQPYARDEETLSRPWAIPGTAGLEHRIGGLEKENGTGEISYDSDNHELMGRLRAAKIERIADEIPPTAIDGAESGKLLLIGWGSTEGTLTQAVRDARKKGFDVSRIHLYYLNPLPKDLGEIIGRFDRVLIPEINYGQLLSVIRSRYLVDAQGLNVMRGQPIKVAEVVEEIAKLQSCHSE